MRELALARVIAFAVWLIYILTIHLHVSYMKFHSKKSVFYCITYIGCVFSGIFSIFSDSLRNDIIIISRLFVDVITDGQCCIGQLAYLHLLSQQSVCIYTIISSFESHT